MCATKTRKRSTTPANERCVAAQDGLLRTILADVSEARMQQDLEALVGFGARDAGLEIGNASRGIRAAREYIVSQLRDSTALDVRVSAWPTGFRGNPL